MCSLYPCRSARPSLRNIVYNNVCVVSVASWKNSTARVLASGCECFSTLDELEAELRTELLALCRHYASCIEWHEPEYRIPRKKPDPRSLDAPKRGAHIFDSDSEGSPQPPECPEIGHDNCMSPYSETGKRIAQDVNDFMNERRNVGRERDALGWWSRQMNRWPIVAAVARHTLCVPASSATSERAFSKTGHIVRARRASLSDENVERLTFLSWNGDLL